MASTEPTRPSEPAAELPKQYRPADHEPRIWNAWDTARAFHADPDRVLSGRARPYAIVIPPPNVTDRLHLGHALNNTLQDVLARAHRMMGFETLWMPGTDHAGIATQAVVERRVWNEEKKRKSDFGRDVFVARIQAFKDEYEAVITGQLKAMGCTCDWERQRFTMDEPCARAVREAFFRLFRDGLIYRGKRLVNWDPALQTAVADDECYDEEVDSSFWYLRYPLVHAHGATTAGERKHHRPPPEDAVPVTWSELEARGYPGADRRPPEEQAWIAVATTRPETYLGDAAVAVNPGDPRARALAGLCVELPLVGRVIPIVQDAYVVLPKALARTEEESSDPKAEFATGFLKVTPAHDPNDYEIYQRHHQAIDQHTGHLGGGLINVMAPDGSISDRHGWTDVGDAHLLVGKKREEARKLVVKEFEARALLEGVRPYRHSVKHSDRSKAVIEPYLSDQWYCKVTDPRLAKAANDALIDAQRTSPERERGVSAGASPSPVSADRSLTFHPDRYAKTYETWHDNIRDWCISRQLWWGHRIPVWTLRTRLPDPELAAALARALNDAQAAFAGANPDAAAQVRDAATGRTLDCPFEDVASGRVRGEALLHVCLNNDATAQALERAGFERDPDVLDTWFSSALWPMSTMGWPDQTPLLQAFNPTSTLCTAREIITLWVSRMVMFNRYFMGAGQGRGPVPFKDVFIHALLMDGEGRKMSKSLGNGVDPLDIIASHGTDALRFTLCQLTTQTQDVRMPVVQDPASGRNTSPKFDLGRNFCNKLWNAARFALGILAAAPPYAGPRPEDGTFALAPVDRWMLSRLAAATRDINQALANFEFSVYAQTVYDLLWRDFCDWYLESIKGTVAGNPLQRSVLAHALQTIVRLLHPVTPFVTEALWERLRDVRTAPIAGIDLHPPRTGGLLCTAGWPAVAQSLLDPDAEARFDRLRALVSAVREVRSRQETPDRKKVTLHLPAAMLDQAENLGGDLIRALAGLERLTTDPPAGPSVVFTFEAAECRLSNLADAVDPAAERARLDKVIADKEKTITTLSGRLANPGYAQKAPPAMVQQTQDQLAQARTELEAARAAIASLGAR
jgi:valyl-tRNA synthetase